MTNLSSQSWPVPPVTYQTGKFPPQEIDWARLIPRIGPANAALARYDGLLAAIPNANILLSPLTTQEAVLSSRIEGTQATMGEVLEYEAGNEKFSPHKLEDIQEILNYRLAMRKAVDSLVELPLCHRVICQAHQTLLSGVRGQEKTPGQLRKIPNYIGTPGRPIEEARYVPISPLELEEGMSRWEKYLHSEQPDLIVQLAIVHAEFESLHPFLDGNGRVGRMLIPLFLYERQVLKTPNFYMSEYLEQNRQEYYDRLLAISRDNQWTEWCEFFLAAITKQAVSNEQKARKILDLYAQSKETFIHITHSQYAIAALDFLFCQPIFTSSELISHSQIPAPTARRILQLLVKEKILSLLVESSGSRGAIYGFYELLDITEGRAPFVDHE